MLKVEDLLPFYDEEQGSLAFCSPWGRKESDMTEGLNNKWIDTDRF